MMLRCTINLKKCKKLSLHSESVHYRVSSRKPHPQVANIMDCLDIKGQIFGKSPSVASIEMRQTDIKTLTLKLTLKHPIFDWDLLK